MAKLYKSKKESALPAALPAVAQPVRPWEGSGSKGTLALYTPPPL